LRFAGVACHQETESIKLREILSGNGHRIYSLPAKFTGVDCNDMRVDRALRRSMANSPGFAGMIAIARRSARST
jgi:hypothetical protein